MRTVLCDCFTCRSLDSKVALEMLLERMRIAGGLVVEIACDVRCAPSFPGLSYRQKETELRTAPSGPHYILAGSNK